MLGMETDVFLIDTKTGKTYNIGEEAGMNEVTKQIYLICGPKNARYVADRFVIIGGIEWGMYTLNPKTRSVKYIPNPNMIRKGKRFASY